MTTPRDEMNDLYYSLVAEQLAWDAAHGWTRVRMPSDELAAMGASEAFLVPRRRVYVADGIMTDADARTRWVSADCWPMTDGELSRQYLHHCIRASRRRPWNRRVGPPATMRQVLYYAGGTLDWDDLAQVDITAAYMSLYAPLGLMPTYASVRLDADKLSPFVRLGELGMLKAVRNSVVSQLARDTVRYLEHGEEMTEKLDHGAITYHPMTAQYVSDVLLQIGRESIALFDFVSYNTDGGCLPGERADGWVKWLADRWALTGRVVRRGSATTYGAARIIWEGEPAGDAKDLPPAAIQPFDPAPGPPAMGYLAPMTRRLRRSIVPPVIASPTPAPAWMATVLRAERLGSHEIEEGKPVVARVHSRKITDPYYCKHCDRDVAPDAVVSTGTRRSCPRCATRLGRVRSVAIQGPEQEQLDLFEASRDSVIIKVVQLPSTLRAARTGKVMVRTVVWWRYRETSGLAYRTGDTIELESRRGGHLDIGYKRTDTRRFGADRENWALTVTNDQTDVVDLHDCNRFGLHLQVRGVQE